MDAAFALYRQHFVVLATACAAAFFPYIVLRFVRFEPANTLKINAEMFAMLALGLACTAVASAAIITVASRGVLGERLDAGEALRGVMGKLPAILAATLGKYVLITLWAVAALIPAALLVTVVVAVLVGMKLLTLQPNAALVAAISIALGIVSLAAALLLITRFFAVTQALLIEHTSIGASFRRSAQLAKGERKRILGVIGLPLIVYVICQLMLTKLLQYLTGSSMVAEAVSQVFTICAYPLLGVIGTLLYYDIRVRKEAYDLELMARELAAAPPPDAAT
ncbi:MAG: hypothetical protein WKG32_09185 [Gemmatimonadaceae bacterium]